MKRALVIVGHPKPGSFCEALGQAYVEGARAEGQEAELLALHRLAFDPAATRGYDPIAIEPDLEAAQAKIAAADHVVWIWPLWFGLPPALMKGFVERIMVPGFAAEMDALGRPTKPLLTGKSARIVVTMAMPSLFYRFWTGAHATSAFRDSILKLVGFDPVRRTLFGRLPESDAAGRAAMLAKMRDLGKAVF